MDAAAQISESDIDRAIEQFNRDVPRALMGLLGAKSMKARPKKRDA